MALAEKYDIQLPESVKRRGEQIVREGRVSVDDLTDGSARLVARGSSGHVYTVTMSRGEMPDRLTAVCSCPGFARSGGCKHVWASLLVLEASAGDWLPDGVVTVLADEPADSDVVDAEPAVPDSRGDESAPPTSRRQNVPDWQRVLTHVRDAADRGGTPAVADAGRDRELWFGLNLKRTERSGRLTVDFFHRVRRRHGPWGQIKTLPVTDEVLLQLAGTPDGEVLELLVGNHIDIDGVTSSTPFRVLRVRLRPTLYEMCLSRLAESGRFRVLRDRPESLERAPAVDWTPDQPWRMELAVNHDASVNAWWLTGMLSSGSSRIELNEPDAVLPGGLVLWQNRLAPLENIEAAAWIESLREEGELLISERERERFLSQLWSLPSIPNLDLPEEFSLDVRKVRPRPSLVMRAPARGSGVDALLGFLYNDVPVSASDGASGVVSKSGDIVYPRDRDVERTAAGRLRELGLAERVTERDRFSCPSRSVLPVAQTLLDEGWNVSLDGSSLRRMTDVRAKVSSSDDWLGVKGEVEFDDVAVPLPTLLKAIKGGDRMVTLDDGSQGLIDEALATRLSALAEMGTVKGGEVRVGSNQALLLDALLADLPHVDRDERLTAVRERMGDGLTIEPVDPPESFKGNLRDYQRVGLGWMDVLASIGIGGCLADDMGLGKTIQVLAALERQRLDKKGVHRRTSLVVVPRSLVHNWIEEAERFTPELRLLSYTGNDREALREQFPDVDLVVTTYGTLRRDITALREIELETVILDEAQAIKNRASQTAKACRLLNARHRLALTGTPVENDLDDILSIFEFLNPGMLGSSRVWQAAADEDEVVDLLARVIRPFLLRRTKEDVLSELPPKTEQTIHCEMGESQRALYEELRVHYRQAILGKVDDVGIKRAKIDVLEALLRLRQAACHPGLLDPDRANMGSAKVDTLLEQLDEVVRSGHKALVFSQFTRFLAIVRDRLDMQRIRYEYLDGRTRDRAERVANFQNDPTCTVFLISLKAGGFGLNLTAADYVFILDPWWNPAVEAQAIDRTHRIGQTKRVTAYRLICQDTVEQRILALQDRKRELADAIVSADKRLVKSLTAEDLELLFG